MRWIQLGSFVVLLTSGCSHVEAQSSQAHLPLRWANPDMHVALVAAIPGKLAWVGDCLKVKTRAGSTNVILGPGFTVGVDGSIEWKGAPVDAGKIYVFGGGSTQVSGGELVGPVGECPAPYFEINEL